MIVIANWKYCIIFVFMSMVNREVATDYLKNERYLKKKKKHLKK